MINRRGAEDARNHLPELLGAAERGQATVITRRGRAVAVLAPAAALETVARQQSLMPFVGSGRGLWGEDIAAAIRGLRDDWAS